jgi:membrane-associated HD superfamily phosphohydrolase
LLAEAFKRVDPHRYVLLASDGCVHLLASTNAPVPAEFKHKRYMKSNPRSNIRDVVQVLYNLLGVSVVQGSSDLAGFIRLLNFFISFQIENEEMVNLNVCSEWFQSIRRQFLQGPSFETPEVWKAKYRNPAIKGLYDSVAKQEQIDTLSSFVDKQATILFSMNSESLDAQLEALRSSATEVRALVEEKSGEIEALKKLLARYDEELDEFSTILGDLHGKVKNLQKEPAAKEAVQVVAEVAQEAAAEVVQEAAAEVVQEAAAEVAQEAAAEVAQEAAAEVVQEAAAEVAQEAAAEVVQEAAAEVVQEAAAEVVQEAAAEAVAEAVAEAAVEVVAEAAVEVSQEAAAEVVAEAAVEVAQEAAAEAAVEVVAEAAVEVVAEAAGGGFPRGCGGGCR